MHLTEALSDKYQSSLKNPNTLTSVVLDCEHIDRIDFTAAQVSNDQSVRINDIKINY